jgi:hypothetical protein
MLQIFPLNDLAAELNETYKQYLQQGGLPLHVLTFNLPDGKSITTDLLPVVDEWRELLSLYIDDKVSEALRWTSTTNSWQTYITVILPSILTARTIRVVQHSAGYSTAYLIRQAAYHKRLKHDIEPWHTDSQQLLQLLAPVMAKAESWINEVIGDDEHSGWMIWYVRKIGQDVALEKGIDYRIHDWEERMQTRNWQ